METSTSQFLDTPNNTSTPQILDTSTPQILDTSTPQILDTPNEISNQLKDLTGKYDTLIKEFSKIQNYPYDRTDMTNEEIVEICTNLKKLQNFSKFAYQYIPKVLNELIL